MKDRIKLILSLTLPTSANIHVYNFELFNPYITVLFESKLFLTFEEVLFLLTIVPWAKHAWMKNTDILPKKGLFPEGTMNQTIVGTKNITTLRIPSLKRQVMFEGSYSTLHS